MIVPRSHGAAGPGTTTNNGWTSGLVTPAWAAARCGLRAASFAARWAHSWATCPSGTGMRGTAAPAGAVAGRWARPVDAGDVEAVASVGGLARDGLEVGAHGGDGVRLGAEAFELAVLAVPPRAPGEHRLREQALAPAGGQALPVEISRVQGPDPHRAILPPAPE